MLFMYIPIVIVVNDYSSSFLTFLKVIFAIYSNLYVCLFLCHKFLKSFLYSFEDKFFLLSKTSGSNHAKRVESISILE